MQSNRTQSCTPRPILKCSGTPSDPRASASHHGCVRFPSSPKLSTVHLTHCSKTYDRRPITVGPNSCAMPERGCRDYDAEPSQGYQWGMELHPSILNRDGSQFYNAGLVPPPLTHDDGSSEESDGIASPPSEVDPNIPSSYRQYVPSQSHRYSEPLSHPPIPRSVPSYNDGAAPSASEYSLNFLPHPPTAQCSMKKRDKTHKSHYRMPSTETQTFNGSWGQSDEASCLGGF